MDLIMEMTSEIYTYASTVNTRIPTNVMHSMIRYYEQKVKVEQNSGKLASTIQIDFHLKGYNPQQYWIVLKGTQETNYGPGVLNQQYWVSESDYALN